MSSHVPDDSLPPAMRGWTKWLRADHIKLHAGEITAGELRSVQAVVRAMLAEAALGVALPLTDPDENGEAVRAAAGPMRPRELETMAGLLEEAAGHLRAFMDSPLAQELRHFLPDELEGSAIMLRDEAARARPPIDWGEVDEELLSILQRALVYSDGGARDQKVIGDLRALLRKVSGRII